MYIYKTIPTYKYMHIAITHRIIHTHTHTYIYVNVDKLIYLCACLYTYIYIYIYSFRQSINHIFSKKIFFFCHVSLEKLLDSKQSQGIIVVAIDDKRWEKNIYLERLIRPFFAFALTKTVSVVIKTVGLKKETWSNSFSLPSQCCVK